MRNYTEDGHVCHFKGTKQAVAVHRAITHGKRHEVRELTRANECPLRREQFTGVRSIAEHVIRSMQMSTCRTTDTTHIQAVREDFSGMKCNTCGEDVKGIGEWQQAHGWAPHGGGQC